MSPEQQLRDIDTVVHAMEAATPNEVRRLAECMDNRELLNIFGALAGYFGAGIIEGNPDSIEVVREVMLERMQSK